MAKEQKIPSWQEMMSAFPLDASAMDETIKTEGKRVEKLSQVAIKAVSKSSDLSANWIKDSLGKLADLSKVNDDPSANLTALGHFASSQAQSSIHYAASLGEVAKKAQIDMLGLFLDAGKDSSKTAASAA